VGSALVIAEPQPAGIMPTVSPDEARAQMRAYQELCAAVLVEEDYQEFTETKSQKIDGRWQKVSTTKRFKKKSAVKKLQTYFGISVDVIDSATHRDDLGDGHFGFRCKAVASSPGGRSVAALAGCSTHEERFDVNRYDDETDAKYAARQKKALARSYHDVLSTAETRATNRAVMNLVSPGEVTAEEISRPPREDRGKHDADPKMMNDAQRDELRGLAQSLGIKIVPFIGTVIPGFVERESKSLNVAEYALVKAALEKLIPAEPATKEGGATDSRANESLSDRPIARSGEHVAREVGVEKPSPATAPSADGDSRMTPRTQGRLFSLLDERLSTEKEARLIFAAEHGIVVDSFSQLTEMQARTLIKKLEMIRPPDPEPDVDDALMEYAEGRLL
jgi:hypothetical protein